MTTAAFAQRRHRSARRHVFVLVALIVALLASISYWLAVTASVPLSVTPAPGTPATGFAKVIPMTSTVTRSNGGAALTAGITLAEVQLGYSAVDRARITVSWTDVATATRVLNNPNAQISVGLYRTVHSGACTSTTGATVADPYVTIKLPTGTSTVTYCTALSTHTTGKFVNATGKVLLAYDQVHGYLLTHTLPATRTLPSCTSTAATWCQPGGLPTAQSRALFVVASIVNPGNTPKGQESQLTSLSFYVSAASAS